MTISGRVAGAGHREAALDDNDLSLVSRADADRQLWSDKMHVVKHIFSAKYFKNELDVAWQKELQHMQRLKDDENRMKNVTDIKTSTRISLPKKERRLPSHISNKKEGIS